MNATLPSIEECKLSSTSCPLSQRVVDSTKLTNTNSQSESITDCMNCFRPAPSGEAIKAESVMDSSDYTGVEPGQSFNRCEDIEERREMTIFGYGYLMSKEQKDILTNMKEEEEDGERQSVKMEGEDGVRDEEGLWKKEEKERDEQRKGHVTDQVAQTDKLEKNGVISDHRQKEGEELSTLVTSCLRKQPRVLIRRLEMASSSIPVSLPPCTLAYKRDLVVRSSWKQHELSSLRGNGSLRQKNGQVMNRKRKTIGQLERPPKMLPSSSENRICAEALISPVISPRNQNTGQTVEVSSQAFACSHCPFVHTEEVNLHQHIEKVHPEELNSTVRSQQPPSSTHQHPTPLKIPPIPTQSDTGTPGSYTCSQCGKSFRRLHKLKLHKRTHTGERPYQCSQCGKSFTQSNILKQHQQIHTGERPYHCSQCGKSFIRSNNLKQHLQTHTGECPYKCSQCGKSFSWCSYLKQHQKTHTGECLHHCSKCGKSFTSSNLLKQHQKTHTGERPYHCSQCGKSFTSSNILKQHQKTHTGERPYHCSQCGRSFTQLNNLKNHLRTHTRDFPYKCSQCGKRFNHLGSLKIHHRIHTGERPYPCSQCGRSFTRLNILKQHQQIHTGERPYHCSLCGKSFPHLRNLKLHKRIHTGERPYHCSQCGKSFTQLTTLKQHQQIHTGERPYHCSQCGKMFTRSHNLKQHQQTHTEERPYQCSQCGKNFTKLNNLKRHQRIHTRDEFQSDGLFEATPANSYMVSAIQLLVRTTSAVSNV